MTKDAIANNPKVRWIVLLLVSIVIGTNYYVYDSVSTIKDTLIVAIGIDNTLYGWYVGLYAFTNSIFMMTIFGGILLDKWGINKTGIMFTSLCFLGIFLSALGASSYSDEGTVLYSIFDALPFSIAPKVKMVLMGRLLFGLGAETSIIVINKIIVKWFKGKELAFAFALNVTIARIGSAVALIAPPFLIESYGWESALWIAALIMGVGFVFFIIYTMYDSKVNTNIKLLAADEEFHVKDIVKIITNKSFLYIILLCVTFYSAVFPFLAYVGSLLQNKFGVSEQMSGMLSSLIIFGTIIFTPIFGKYVDKRGNRATLMIYGSSLLLLSHLLLSLTSLSPYIPMFTLGIAFSLVPAAMWPSVAIIVEEKVVGTAYGIMTSLQNLGLFIFPILAGYILDATNVGITPEMVKEGTANYDYTYTVLMFAGLGVVGLVFAFLLKWTDKKPNGHGLEIGNV